MSCDHVLGTNFGGCGECGVLIRLSDTSERPSFKRSDQTQAQAEFGSIDHPFQFCPDCGQVNEMFTGLFDSDQTNT
jgi:hypothetical protein